MARAACPMTRHERANCVDVGAMVVIALIDAGGDATAAIMMVNETAPGWTRDLVVDAIRAGIDRMAEP